MWLAGVGLLLLLTVDVFLTVFHPQAHGGPFSRRMMSGIWWGLSRVGRVSGRFKNRLLSLAGPMLALLSLFWWGLLMLIAFAFIYADHVDQLVFTRAPGADWIEAVYFSGTLLSTVGLGDVVAGVGWLRLVSFAESLSGFVLVSVAVTYVVSVYQAHRESTSLAMDIGTLFGDDPERGIHRALRHLDRLDSFAHGAAQRLNGLVSAYKQYPVLHYFRPPDPRQSVLVQIGILLRFFEQLERRSTLRGDEYLSVNALRNALDNFLGEVAEVFAGDHVEVEDDLQGLWAQRYRRALVYMNYPPDIEARDADERDRGRIEWTSGS